MELWYCWNLFFLYTDDIDPLFLVFPSHFIEYSLMLTVWMNFVPFWSLRSTSTVHESLYCKFSSPLVFKFHLDSYPAWRSVACICRFRPSLGCYWGIEQHPWLYHHVLYNYIMLEKWTVLQYYIRDLACFVDMDIVICIDNKVLQPELLSFITI